MNHPASIEVKCECIIPFQSELVGYLNRLSDSAPDDQLEKIPHKDAIREALKSKMLFVRIRFARPVKQWRPRILKAAKSVLHKDLVGTIKVGKNEITLILL